MELRVYQYKVLTRSSYFRGKILDMQHDHNHLTRFRLADGLTSFNIRVSSYFRSFLYQGVKFWNALPVDIKSINNYRVFKGKLNIWLRSVDGWSEIRDI
jgi:hypothetical protein